MRTILVKLENVQNGNNGSVNIQTPNPRSHAAPGDDSVNISFEIPGYYFPHKAVEKLSELLTPNNCTWLSSTMIGPRRAWLLYCDVLRAICPESLAGIDWLYGRVYVKFNGDAMLMYEYKSTAVDFTLKRYSNVKPYSKTESVEMWQQEKIFLSHKGANKPLVRDFYETLTLMGFNVWLDEHAMTAGTELERGILQGFKESCAAVFFITSAFRDEGYLATEVNYAIQQKRLKGKRFSIISIVLADEEGCKGSVSDLLRQYVWKEPNSHLEALREIIRALPIVIEATPYWKSWAIEE